MSQTIHDLLHKMVEQKASDLYLTFGSPPNMRINDTVASQGGKPLRDADIDAILDALLTAEQRDEFRSTFELNLAFHFNEMARFRINVFRQQGHDGVVIRRVEPSIPTIESLGLPASYANLALMKRGLILVSGPSGSGKSTSLAAMVDHRNRHGHGHIITIEDPIEFIHQHNQCIITQRDVGLDTYSYALALKNALRQRPDMVVIGEVRDREVMEHAIHFAETGHLCVATIHANNASQTIERVLNFFPEERHQQILQNLSLNLRATLAQRLINTVDDKRTLALEIMLNRGLITQLIEQGKINQIPEMIEKGSSDGMQSFNSHLFDLYQRNIITEAVALTESDGATGLRLMIQNKRTSERSATLMPVTLRQNEF